MSITTSKRAMMILFSGRGDLSSQQVRMVLEEKDVIYENEIVENNSVNEDLLELNRYGTVPTLVEKDLIIFNPQIIMAFLDERYPHPSLMPAYPIMRAQTRMFINQIEKDWISIFDKIEKLEPGDPAIIKNLSQVKEEILAIADIFAQTPYFMSDEFNLLDCYIAPILWQLKVHGIQFNENSAKPIRKYMKKIFARNSFKKSIIDAKQKMLLQSEI